MSCKGNFSLYFLSTHNKLREQVVGNREDPHGNLEPYAADRFKPLRRPVNLKMQIKLI